MRDKSKRLRGFILQKKNQASVDERQKNKSCCPSLSFGKEDTLIRILSAWEDLNLGSHSTAMTLNSWLSLWLTALPAWSTSLHHARFTSPLLFLHDQSSVVNITYKCYTLPRLFTIKVFMYACLGSCYSCRKGHFPSDGSDKVTKEGVDSTFFLALQQRRQL